MSCRDTASACAGDSCWLCSPDTSCSSVNERGLLVDGRHLAGGVHELHRQAAAGDETVGLRRLRRVRAPDPRVVGRSIRTPCQPSRSPDRPSRPTRCGGGAPSAPAPPGSRRRTTLATRRSPREVVAWPSSVKYGCRPTSWPLLPRQRSGCPTESRKREQIEADASAGALDRVEAPRRPPACWCGCQQSARAASGSRPGSTRGGAAAGCRRAGSPIIRLKSLIWTSACGTRTRSRSIV